MFEAAFPKIIKHIFYEVLDRESTSLFKNCSLIYTLDKPVTDFIWNNFPKQGVLLSHSGLKNQQE